MPSPSDQYPDPWKPNSSDSSSESSNQENDLGMDAAEDDFGIEELEALLSEQPSSEGSPSTSSPSTKDSILEELEAFLPSELDATEDGSEPDFDELLASLGIEGEGLDTETVPSPEPSAPFSADISPGVDLSAESTFESPPAQTVGDELEFTTEETNTDFTGEPASPIFEESPPLTTGVNEPINLEGLAEPSLPTDTIETFNLEGLTESPLPTDQSDLQSAPIDLGDLGEDLTDTGEPADISSIDLNFPDETVVADPNLSEDISAIPAPLDVPAPADQPLEVADQQGDPNASEFIPDSDPATKVDNEFTDVSEFAETEADNEFTDVSEFADITTDSDSGKSSADVAAEFVPGTALSDSGLDSDATLASGEVVSEFDAPSMAETPEPETSEAPAFSQDGEFSETGVAPVPLDLASAPPINESEIEPAERLEPEERLEDPEVPSPESVDSPQAVDEERDDSVAMGATPASASVESSTVATAPSGTSTYKQILSGRKQISAFAVILAGMAGVAGYSLLKTDIKDSVSTNVDTPEVSLETDQNLGEDTVLEPSDPVAPAADQTDQSSVASPAPQTNPAETNKKPVIVPSVGKTPPAESEDANIETPPPIDISDVPPDHWVRPYVEAMYEQGVIPDFPDGKFQPDKPVTRAELAASIQRAFKDRAGTEAIPFSDISDQYWAKDAITHAVNTGFMSGYSDDIFEPDQQIPRYQVLVSLVSGLGLAKVEDPQAAANALADFPDVGQMPDWALGQVAASQNASLIINRPEDAAVLDPERPATRAEVSAMIYKALVNAGKIEDTVKE